MQSIVRRYCTNADDPIVPDVPDDLGGQGEDPSQQGLGPGDRETWYIEPTE